ncbi:hypothetical protein KAS42_03445 [bacterium]|nr:hypothetical protein [bacterium]
MSDPLKIFRDVAISKIIDKKWAGQPHEAFKHLGNTSKGDTGQEFITQYARELGFTAENFGRTGDKDITIGNKNFEVKLASEDTAGSFQFNHIRLDYRYDFIICLGVTPSKLLFQTYSKADIATNKVGTLVSMGRGQNSSFKLTKKKCDLLDIHNLKDVLSELLK